MLRDFTTVMSDTQVADDNPEKIKVSGMLVTCVFHRKGVGQIFSFDSGVRHSCRVCPLLLSDRMFNKQW